MISTQTEGEKNTQVVLNKITQLNKPMHGSRRKQHGAEKNMQVKGEGSLWQWLISEIMNINMICVVWKDKFEEESQENGESNINSIFTIQGTENTQEPKQRWMKPKNVHYSV